MPDTIAKHLAHQQDRHIPARVIRAKHLAYERAGDPCPLRSPGKRHALPNRRPSHRRTRPSPAAPPGKPAGQRADAGKCTLSSAANVKPHMAPADPAGARPSLRSPSVAVRAKPMVPRAAPTPRTPCALCVRGPRNTGVYSATR